MEVKIISGYRVITHRKNNTKLVLSLRDKAIELLGQGKGLSEIADELGSLLESHKKCTHTYISHYGITRWNDRESVSIRNCSMDCTYVSISSHKGES